MAIEDVKQLKTVNGITQAQRLLDQGWQILAVCVIQDGSSQYAEYHLGHTDTPNAQGIGPNPGALVSRTRMKQ